MAARTVSDGAPSPIMTAREIARLLPSRSEATVRHLWSKGKLESQLVGRWRVSTREAVARFLHVNPADLG